MQNVSKPTTSLANASRISFAELWSTITSTWATETRTWGATASLITDAARVSSTMTNVSKPS